jgi:excinuclease ABC subunit C
VRSYFRKTTSDDRYFVSLLKDLLSDIDVVVVDSEKEAVLLENQLIKQHRPRFNVKLRDDKEYLSLRLDTDTTWPRLEVVRRPRPDSARYFGPYPSASSARKTLRLVNRHFKLRTCTDRELHSRTRPCLQYQIHRCAGPCVLPVDPESYGDYVRGVGLFLDGRHDELIAELENQMTAASEELRYEEAAGYRDQIRAVTGVTQGQRVSAVRDIDQDVIGFHREADLAEVVLAVVRQGRIIEVRSFSLGDLAVPDDEMIAGFLAEYYGQGSYVPHEIIVPTSVEAADGMASALSEGAGHKVRILRPRRGDKHELLRLATENATQSFLAKRRAFDDTQKRLEIIRDRLRLPRLPRDIECIDVSHHGGQDTVAVFVCLRDGTPDRSRYRSFNIRGVGASDDYGAMHEAISRRLLKMKKGWVTPDLLVLDGGRGQLSTALAVMQDLGIENLPTVALAKERKKHGATERVDRIYLPGQKNPIPVERDAALRILAHARDEAHRFSNDRRRRVQKKRTFRSPLEAIPGVGPRTRDRLLRGLGSVAMIKSATKEELIEAGANRIQADSISSHFAGSPELASAELPSDAEDTAEIEAVENAFDSVLPPAS